MRCPRCSFGATRVIDSRDLENGRFTRRRRQCSGCSSRWTTYEVTPDDFRELAMDNLLGVLSRQAAQALAKRDGPRLLHRVRRSDDPVRSPDAKGAA